MKERVFSQKITTFIGSALAIIALVLFTLNFIVDDIEFGWIQLIPSLLLSWVFIAAKDSLLEGITANVFKLNNNSK